MIQSLPDEELMYKALLDKDAGFEGIFLVGVKSTGIFCRPTCSARKPKRENVEFFPNTHEALCRGYRPCKLCNPMSPKGAVPEWLQPLMNEIRNHPDKRFKDSDLIAMGIEPNRVRRWFKKHHNMTFQTYLRTMRIGAAFGRIKYGDTVLHTAYGSGYESLSGFTDTFKKTTGFSPNKSQDRQLVYINRILTPLGPMLAGATESGICLLEFVDRRMLESQLDRLRRYLKAELVPGSNHHIDELNTQLTEYFDAERTEFSLPLVFSGTEFQKSVWRILQTIPYGCTRSYRQQAELLGAPKAVRAVARANGDNKIAVIIPCHRVIGSNGRLTGYGGGLWRKKYLLELETQKQPVALPV
jgi:AraC family transcriptional regulator of adaptative response/methylated-DNA-[protein]-cysteine methyltransferase